MDHEHGMNCPARTPNSDEFCTCGLEWRIKIDRLKETIESAHAPLKALLDPAMPADLKGAVEYLIDHGNEGWMRLAIAMGMLERDRSTKATLQDTLGKCQTETNRLQGLVVNLQAELAEMEPKTPSYSDDFISGLEDRRQDNA